jgi:low temperature requirement protein LtrA
MVAVTAVAGSCALWWTYFGWAKDRLEETMRSQSPARIGRYARDVYSFGHFPLIFGVIGYAISVEETIAHPQDPLAFQGVLALGVGVSLILGGTALALTMAGARVPAVRWWVIIGLLGSIPALGQIPAWVALALVSLLVAVLALVERGQRPIAIQPATGSPNISSR